MPENDDVRPSRKDRLHSLHMQMIAECRASLQRSYKLLRKTAPLVDANPTIARKETSDRGRGDLS